MFWPKQLPVYFLFLSILGIHPLLGQNLVPDPGFEIWDGNAGVPPYTLASLQHWYTANGTADHHHVDIEGGSNLTGLDPDCPTGQGHTWCGFPYEGGGVLGCWKGNGPDGSKEWGGTRLLEPLKPGACYEISFWIQNKKDNPQALYETNQWGVFFNDTQFPLFNANLSDFSVFADRWVATTAVIGGSEWQQVRLNYTAPAAYQYMYIGYMGNVSTSTFTVANDDYLLGFYAWFDEVVVEEITIDVPESQTICKGDSILLEFTSKFPITWTDGVNTDTTRSVWVSPETTTSYTAFAFGSQGCSTYKSLVINVVEPEQMDYPSVVCEATTPFLLDETQTSGSWHGSGITDPATGLFDPAVAGVGTALIEFRSTADCTQNFSLFVEVEAVPEASIIADYVEGCAPAAFTFEVESSSEAMTYSWSLGDGTIVSDQTTVTYTFTEPGQYIPELSITHFENCTTTVSLEAPVEVHPTPSAQFSYGPEMPDIFENEVVFEDQSNGVITQWEWFFGDGFASRQPAPKHEYQSPGTYEVQLLVTTKDNCTDSITQLLTVKNAVRMYVPNAFSPNDDGFNDQFEIGYVGELYDYEMSIFNRWGTLIFQTNNPGEFWNGKSSNGKPADMGVYTYMIAYTILPETSTSGALQEMKSGSLTLLR